MSNDIQNLEDQIEKLRDVIVDLVVAVNKLQHDPTKAEPVAYQDNFVWITQDGEMFLTRDGSSHTGE